jgi:hypothetical protein
MIGHLRGTLHAKKPYQIAGRQQWFGLARMVWIQLVEW